MDFILIDCDNYESDSCFSNGKMVPSIKLLLRYLQRLVSHPSLLQDPDVREFLEKEEVRDISLVHTL